MSEHIPHTSGADSQFQSVTSLINFERSDVSARSEELPANSEVSADAVVQNDGNESSRLQRKHLIPQWSHSPTREARASKLMAALAKPVEGYFEAGDLLKADKKDLKKQEFKKLLEEVGLSFSSANNYMRVADAEHLRKPEFLHHLPCRLGALIDLANPKRWSEETIRACIDAGRMRPGTTREQLKEWRDKHDSTDRKERKPKSSKYLYEAGYILYFHQSLSNAARGELVANILNWRPSNAAAVDAEAASFVALRKTTARDVKEDLYDRYSDACGTAVHKDGEAKDAPRKRPPDETVGAEPWDNSLGPQPGTKI